MADRRLHNQVDKGCCTVKMADLVATVEDKLDSVGAVDIEDAVLVSGGQG